MSAIQTKTNKIHWHFLWITLLRIRYVNVENKFMEIGIGHRYHHRSHMTSAEEFLIKVHKMFGYSHSFWGLSCDAGIPWLVRFQLVLFPDFKSNWFCTSKVKPSHPKYYYSIYTWVRCRFQLVNERRRQGNGNGRTELKSRTFNITNLKGRSLASNPKMEYQVFLCIFH